MFRLHLARVALSVAVVIVATSGCSSTSSSEDAGAANDCEAAFSALCDKGATCSPSGEVAFGTAPTGDAGAGGGTVTFGSAASCKSLYNLGCASSPPANVAACKAAVATAQCSTPAGGKPRLAFPKECETPQK